MSVMDEAFKKMLGIDAKQIADMGAQAQQLAQFVINRLNSHDEKLDRILAMLTIANAGAFDHSQLLLTFDEGITYDGDSDNRNIVIVGGTTAGNA